jgi:hypothetical protein
VRGWGVEKVRGWEVWNAEVGMRNAECGMRKQPHGAKSIAPGVGSLEGEKMRGWEGGKSGMRKAEMGKWK